MQSLFEVVVQRLAMTSLQSAVLVAVVWLLCKAMPRLPASTQCWLWWMVGLQAVLGLFVAPVELAVLPAAAPVAQAVGATVTALPSASPSLWVRWVVAAWLAGVVVMLARSAVAWRISRRQVQATEPCTDQALLAALQLAADAHGLRHAPPLRLSAQIDSPQLIGLWRPVLLLPSRRLASISDDELDMALTHELVHLRRQDLLWGLLPALAQHLFFFHPLLHLAAREYAIAREAACDAAVVAGHVRCRHDYGRLLVSLGVSAAPVAGVSSASPSFLSLKRRLIMLQNTNATPGWRARALVAVAVLGVAPLRLVAMPAPLPSPALQPIVVTASAAPAMSHGMRRADGAEQLHVQAAPAAPAMPAAPAAPANGVLAGVLDAPDAQDSWQMDATGWDADAQQRVRDAIDEATRSAKAAEVEARAAAQQAIDASDLHAQMRQDELQAAQDALAQAREQLDSLGPELEQAKQDAQQQVREAAQQIREVALQQRNAQYAYVAAARQAAELSRHQAEMDKEAARQDRLNAARAQPSAAGTDEDN
ncbi:M56 family metallopeptidase [Xanthomonas sp. 4461]|uniref:M56 family metallopeptidase n=1 Tax=Xanthomonas sp. 4461 TaxID=3035313 RepID=UPI002167AD68|nr:M56 family metallopeptidase [Xanthomonas sp. 4461]MCS3809643.1 beta-lactamase regulating signal transducer with metallopeptidase domain [Xanthomonas sp. 4461]